MHVLDYVFGLTALGPRFFQDGWGDRALCEAMDPQALSRRKIPRLEVTLGEARREHGGLLHEGSFVSPEARLPPCARTARIQLLLPEQRIRAVALHLAASGDQGFGVRLRFAAPLLERGIGALVLENAYYGARRPANQPRHAYRSISDLHLMGAATFQEGRALLRWLREVLRVPLVGVTGYSMGGQFSAMVGAAVPFPCAIVPVAAPCSPDTVLREGVLHHVAEWAAIAGGAPDLQAAKEELLAHLARFSVTALPPPLWPEAAIVVGTAGDGVVPPSEMERIAKHWGAELRWLPAGHVSAVLRHRGAMRQAIADAFDRLEARTASAAVRRSGRARQRAARSVRRAPGSPASGAARARARGPAAAPRT
jgi:dienelactone hydrolase